MLGGGGKVGGGGGTSLAHQSERRQAMKRWQKILLVGFHAIMLALLLCMIIAGVQLRWHLGYLLFWGAALSGMAFYFIRDNSLSKIYSFCWIGLSVFGIIGTFITYDSVYCETDKYIMKEPSDIIGFNSAILYEKRACLKLRNGDISLYVQNP